MGVARVLWDRLFSSFSLIRNRFDGAQLYVEDFYLSLVIFINIFRLLHTGKGHFAGIQMQNKAAWTSIGHLEFRQNGSAFTITPAP